MQILADVLRMTVKTFASEHTCALGASMYAAVIDGIYQNINDAQNAMIQPFDKKYVPDFDKHKIYCELYKMYQKTGSFYSQK